MPTRNLDDGPGRELPVTLSGIGVGISIGSGSGMGLCRP